MAKDLKIGIIGLDTSHAPAFTKLLNDTSDPAYVAGGKVVVAFPGGSPDFEASISRVGKFTQEVRNFGVKIVDTPEAVAEESDVLLIESADGRVHLNQFKRIISYKKPTFIDKPLTLNSAEAEEIFELAEKNGIPMMSHSPARFAPGLVAVLADAANGEITGVDFYGPLKLQPTQTGYFWYGIHTVEMAFTALGKGCVEVSVDAHEKGDVIIGKWKDGRKAVIRANLSANNTFGGAIHREKGTQNFEAGVSYPASVTQIIKMFQTGKSPIDPEETLEIIRFLEAANESKENGKPVQMECDSFASSRLAC